MAGHTNRASYRLEQCRAKANQVDIADWFMISAHRTRKSAQTFAIFGLRNRIEQGVGKRDLTQQLHRVMVDIARPALFQPLGDASQAGGKAWHGLGATGNRQQHQPLFKCTRWYGEPMRIGAADRVLHGGQQRTVGNELLLIGNSFRLVDLDGLVAEMAACCENGGGMAGWSAALGQAGDDGREIALGGDRDLDLFCVQLQHHFERESAGFDSRCFRQGREPYRVPQTGLADGVLQGLAVECREEGRPIDLHRRCGWSLASLGPQGQDNGDLVPTDGRRRAAAARPGEAFVVEPHRGALDGTDNFIGARGFKVHIDRIGARAANNALGSHCFQGRVVNLGVERDELWHDREQTLSP